MRLLDCIGHMLFIAMSAAWLTFFILAPEWEPNQVIRILELLGSSGALIVSVVWLAQSIREKEET